MTPRPYQVAAIDAAFAEFVKGVLSTLIVLPTGCGKTVVFSEFARLITGGRTWVKHDGRPYVPRVLILAHRKELVEQAAEKVAITLGCKPDIEMGDQRQGSGQLFDRAQVVVGSVQSVARRLSGYDPREFCLVVIDEAHHCTVSNAHYWTIVQHFRQNPHCRLLGVTATPDRADGVALGQIFDSVAYEMQTLDAIHQGWLVPIHQEFARVEGLDFSKVRTIAGDLSEGDLENLMTEDGGRMLHEIAGAALEAAKKEQCLVFMPRVGSSELVAKILSRDSTAVCLHGKTPKEVRTAKLKEFQQNQIQFLVGCDLFLEGFDAPNISVIVNGKPTKARNRYAQMVGRGTRLFPGCINGHETPEARRNAIAASPKQRCLVVDLTGDSAQHKLVNAVQMLAGEYAEEVVLAAEKSLKDGGKSMDARQALRKAHLLNQVNLWAQEQQQTEGRGKGNTIQEALVGRAQMSREIVDPFSQNAETAYSGLQQRKGGPTEKQAAFLQAHGYDPDQYTQGEAGRTITKILESKKKGTPSPKQLKCLERAGMTAQTGLEASLKIDLLRARNYEGFSYPLTLDLLTVRSGDEGYFATIRDPQKGEIKLSKTFPTPEKCRAYYGPVLTQTAEAL